VISFSNKCNLGELKRLLSKSYRHQNFERWKEYILLCTKNILIENNRTFNFFLDVSVQSVIRFSFI